jgi:hypothetical protein
MKSIVPVVALLAVAGCSNQAVYDTIQLNQQQRCAQVTTAEYEACMEGVGKPYQQYQREREALLEE